MDNISQKNERFVLDGLELLTAVDDIKNCETNIIKLINKIKQGDPININSIFKEFEEVEYYETKINDIVSSIFMHSSNIEYESSDFESIRFATKKNGYLHDVGILKNIKVQELIPAFNVNITNLGIQGIKATDKLIIKLFNDSVDVFINLDMPIGVDALEVGDDIAITISSLKCPQIAYEYTLDISIVSNNYTYGQIRVTGINIKDGGSTDAI